MDMNDVKGQSHIKRALEVAAAGAHSVLLVGPEGCGKSMLLERFPTIAPEPMNRFLVDEFVGTKFLADLLTDCDEDNGVLQVNDISRMTDEQLRLVADYMNSGLVVMAETRPCPCGNLEDALNVCSCLPEAVEAFRRRLKETVLPLFPIALSLTRLRADELQGPPAGEFSAAILKRVQKKHEYAKKHHKDYRKYDAEMDATETVRYCNVTGDGDCLLRAAVSTLGFTARTHSMVLKVARTIADLADMNGEDYHPIGISAIAEAVHYQALRRNF